MRQIQLMLLWHKATTYNRQLYYVGTQLAYNYSTWFWTRGNFHRNNTSIWALLPTGLGNKTNVSKIKYSAILQVINVVYFNIASRNNKHTQSKQILCKFNKSLVSVVYA